MQCEMCGSEPNKLFRAVIEGVELKVCGNCSRYGKFLGPLKADSPTEPKVKASLRPLPPKPEVMDVIVENYSKLIKDKRERLGLKQKELALKIAEKESIIHKIESGQFMPSLALARKLERFLNIRLIEQHKEVVGFEQQKKRPGTFTIGDFIKVKKR